MANILIIDDDEMLCDMLSRHLKKTGHQVRYDHRIQDGLHTALSSDFDVVFLDVGLPDGNGLDLLPRLRELPSSPEVIIFTADGDPGGAETAIRSGAWDYIEKPPTVKGMMLPLLRALQYRDEKKNKPKIVLKRDAIVGTCPPLKKSLELVAEAATSEVNVLVTGETGTGKELFAKSVHENSRRANRNFVVVDCASLPDTLVESMLFGHEKGAFTGADRSQDGLIKQADGGTLFLDEVGELPLSVQKSFLRVLQERTFRSVGGKNEISSDFRLVAATNRNLDKMVRSGEFREDLLFRLKSFVIDLPPLKECREDIKTMSFFYIARNCERLGIEIKGLSPEFIEALSSYDWPGNVRELVNTIEKAISSAWYEPILYPNHLSTHIRVKIARASVAKNKRLRPPLKNGTGSPKDLPRFQDSLEAFRRNYIKDLMSQSKSDIREALRISGLSRSTLYEYLKKYQISSSQ